MFTNTKNLYQRLLNLEDEILKLNNMVHALKATDIQQYQQNYEELSTNAALRAERIACRMRGVVYIADTPNKADYMALAAKAQGIHIESEHDILIIQMPGLLPKRKVRTNTAFLHEPLNFAIQEYIKNHNLQLYRNCVVCFSQIYDETLPLRRIRDYDNLEFKQILDTISTYVLVDDSGLFCDSYFTTELGNQDDTVVYIMDKSVFPYWVEGRKNDIKSISEIS